MQRAKRKGLQCQKQIQTLEVYLKNKTNSVGNDLLSQGPASPLPSALEGLTARFGMGLGVPPPLVSPTELIFLFKIGLLP